MKSVCTRVFKGYHEEPLMETHLNFVNKSEWLRGEASGR